MKYKGKEDADFYKTSKFDKILIGLILFFSVVSIIWIMHNRIQQSSQPKAALIYQKDKLMEEVDLNKDRIITLLDGRMQIEVKRGQIRVVKSDCSQRICVNMGWIQYAGQTIVCVPNKVLVEIKSTGSSLLDVIAN